MTDDALSQSLLVLLNEAFRPSGVWLRKATAESRSAAGLVASSYNLRPPAILSLFANEDGFGELRPCLMLQNPLFRLSPTVFDIDLADPAFPEKAAEWVRSALSQS